MWTLLQTEGTGQASWTSCCPALAIVWAWGMSGVSPTEPTPMEEVWAHSQVMGQGSGGTKV